MLENLIIGFATSALLVGGFVLLRRKQKVRTARLHRERLLSLIGLREDAQQTSGPACRHWWGAFKTRLQLK